MKNRKGFTLVELLAVIAILAILMVIAIPGIITLFNNAKTNAFITEAKAVYKAASQKYNADVFATGQTTQDYTTGDLDLNGSDIQYLVNFKNNKMVYFYVQNGENILTLNNSDIKISDITENKKSIDTEGTKLALDNSKTVIDNTKDGTLKNYRIYGNAEGIKNINIVSYGKNLFDNNFDNYIEMTSSSTYSLSNNVYTFTNSTDASSQRAQFFIPSRYFESGKWYTISCQINYSINSSRKITMGYGTSVLFKELFEIKNQALPTGESIQMFTKSFTPDFSAYPVETYKNLNIYFYLGTNETITVSNIQIEEGTSATTYDEKGPKTIVIKLTNPLFENDYIDYAKQQIVRENGSIETLNLSGKGIATYDANTNLIITTDNGSPNEVYITK